MSERALLERLADGPVSGDVLAREAGQTRAAVWKRIQALREAGIGVEAVPGRGYRLSQAPDLLDAAAIIAQLAPQARGLLHGLEVVWRTPSTNDALLATGAPMRGCAVLLAERQSAGRGRRGRAWVTPLAAQVALSVARRYAGGLARLPGLSLVAGVATADALHALGMREVRLKWPNDLVVVMPDGALRKLGGILVEGGGEAGGGAHAVIGIGVNVRVPGPAMAGVEQAWIDLAALGGTPSRNTIASSILSQLLPALEAFDADGLAPWLPRFEALHALAGMDVLVDEAGARARARVLGIAADGALRVRGGDGRERCVHAGDVSLARA